MNGAARGLGATIALMCDIVYMADTASIGDAHTQFGLPAGDGGQVIWPLLGGAEHREGIPDARRRDRSARSRNASVWSTGCSPASELHERTMTCAREIAARPPAGVRWTKLAVNKMVLDQLNLTLDFGLATECSRLGEPSRSASWGGARRLRA